MLSFTNLALRRGPNLLFEDVSFVIHRDKKVGLIGANGAGKTSLFKMITGELDVEDGYLDYPQDLRISYLAQEVVGTDQRAVEYVLEETNNSYKFSNKLNLQRLMSNLISWVSYMRSLILWMATLLYLKLSNSWLDWDSLKTTWIKQ